MKKRFGFYDHDYDYDYDEKRNEKLVKIFKSNLFSQEFKDMVASCLDQDPSRRPSTDQLLEYPFFKNCHEVKFHSDVFFFTLPNVEERFKERKALHDGTPSQIAAGTETDSAGSAVKNRRISGWKFNESKLELEPGFYADADVKTVRFGGETIIDTDTNIGLSESPGGSGDLEGLVVDHAGVNMHEWNRRSC
jgi:serine/threonine-protein kinase OSR1/STK39